MSKTEQRTYDGVEFELDEQFWFAVPSLDARWQSYSEMTKGIDRSRKVIEATARESLSLKCVDARGVSRTVTGLHAGRGHLLVKPNWDAHERAEVYPDVGWVGEALREKSKAEAILAKINAVLTRLALKPLAWRLFKPEGHHAIVADIKQQYAAVEKITSKKTFDDLVRESNAVPLEF